MTLLLIAVLVILALFTAIRPKLMDGVVALSAFSLVSALLFYILRAPDVAITEAAVGAGVSTVIFVWAIKDPPRGP